MKNDITNDGAVWIITMYQVLFARLCLFLPLQIFWPNVYTSYIPLFSHPASLLIFAWFVFGSYKVTMMIAWNTNGEYWGNMKLQCKSALMVPVAGFIPFRREWYRLPDENNQRSPGNEDDETGVK